MGYSPWQTCGFLSTQWQFEPRLVAAVQVQRDVSDSVSVSQDPLVAEGRGG